MYDSFMIIDLVESGDLVKFDSSYYIVLSICFDENNCILSPATSCDLEHGKTHTVLTQRKSCDVVMKSYSLLISDLC